MNEQIKKGTITQIVGRVFRENSWEAVCFLSCIFRPLFKWCYRKRKPTVTKAKGESLGKRAGGKVMKVQRGHHRLDNARLEILDTSLPWPPGHRSLSLTFCFNLANLNQAPQLHWSQTWASTETEECVPLSTPPGSWLTKAGHFPVWPHGVFPCDCPTSPAGILLISACSSFPL